jgi:hypothetical protein
MYDVARGTLNELAVGTSAVCIAVSPDAFHDDFDVPGPNVAYYYIVRATNACGAGPWGQGVKARTVTCP